MAKNKGQRQEENGTAITETEQVGVVNRLTFDNLIPAEIELDIRNPRTKQLETFVLQEPLAEAGIAYKDRLAACHKFGPDGRVIGVQGKFQVELELLASCLFRTAPKGSEGEELIEVTLAEVQSWPDRVTSKLIEKLKEMCPDLDGRETLESVQKKIDQLLRIKEILEKQGGVGGVSKNSQPAMAGSSS